MDVNPSLALVLGAVAFYVMGLLALGILWRVLHLRVAIVLPLAIVVIAIPWADQLWARRQFHTACTAAGLEALRKATVDGFFDSTSFGFEHDGVLTNRRAIERFERSGFQFYERPAINPKGKVWHLENAAGQWRITILDQQSARYEFAAVTDPNAVGRLISCTDDVVLDRQERVTIARYKHCKRYPTFFENLFLRYFYVGPVDFCPVGERELNGLLYQQVLTPSKGR